MLSKPKIIKEVVPEALAVPNAMRVLLEGEQSVITCMLKTDVCRQACKDVAMLIYYFKVIYESDMLRTVT